MTHRESLIDTLWFLSRCLHSNGITVKEFARKMEVLYLNKSFAFAKMKLYAVGGAGCISKP